MVLEERGFPCEAPIGGALQHVQRECESRLGPLRGTEQHGVAEWRRQAGYRHKETTMVYTTNYYHNNNYPVINEAIQCDKPECQRRTDNAEFKKHV